MAVFKCKMCGANLPVEQGQGVAFCGYCGTKQTLPKLTDEKREQLYQRAGHLRRNNEFDKAMAIYEQIVLEDTTDAEAYWSLVLCRFGIEYVEDPATKKRTPTVNRTQLTSIFDDENYKLALEYADSSQREVYELEAKVINMIQKGILEISSKEKPFDVFICYKETDDGGRRTPDSVLANDLYHQLTKEGFKVFFSRITLEDKLGMEYEPYIFAALQSAKVMVVLGTRAEYFNAPWVKNEWSRFLALMKSGQEKMLVPAYRDMDVYNLPEEFSHLQAQDMSKLGFMQDLIRGIGKLVGKKEEEKPAPAVAPVASPTTPLLKRVFYFLEDGEFADADEYCEKVLDIEPENGMAYVGKLLVSLKLKKQEELKELPRSFESNVYYQKAIRFGDDQLKETLNGYLEEIKRKQEEDRKDSVLAKAKDAMSWGDYHAALILLKPIAGWKDADEQIKLCERRVEEWRRDSSEMSGERVDDNGTRKKIVIAIAIVLVGVLFIAILPKNKGRSSSSYNDYYSSYTYSQSCSHYWQNATCEKPETCLYCEETQGYALGHEWEAATCTEAKTCTRCYQTQGEPLSHSLKAATHSSPKQCKNCDYQERTKVYGSDLDQEWGDEKIDIGEWEVTPKYFGSELKNCAEFNLYYYMEPKDGGTVKGDFKVYVQISGSWKYVQTIKYAGKEEEFTILLGYDKPLNITGVVVTPPDSFSGRFTSKIYVMEAYTVK